MESVGKTIKKKGYKYGRVIIGNKIKPGIMPDTDRRKSGTVRLALVPLSLN